MLRQVVNLSLLDILLHASKLLEIAVLLIGRLGNPAIGLSCESFLGKGRADVFLAVLLFLIVRSTSKESNILTTVYHTLKKDGNNLVNVRLQCPPQIIVLADGQPELGSFTCKLLIVAFLLSYDVIDKPADVWLKLIRSSLNEMDEGAAHLPSDIDIAIVG
ncbi:hypothetical protein HG530_000152 [Fusarium avenaceum]|nr:hypothetical protein HG530_000152 [Fusarium avenaceum]